MSDAKTMIECRDVSIRYRVGDFKNIGLKEWVMRRLTGRYRVVDFWADRNVSFTLKEGDMLGIIGTNGAGKSTLLKAITGIMKPTKGSVSRRGKVAALLELASGFDADLTVKENAYLRGAMLGYTRGFMDRTYPYIIDFSELKEFEDRPFKQLSSGMKSRLAFAIASLVKPEILILDEVLSVGDGAFKAKSEAKMREIIRGGATTILVSHSLSQIRAMCTKVLWLDKGRQIVFSGDVEGVCDSYEEFLKGGSKVPRYDPEAAKARMAERAALHAGKVAEARRQAEDAAKLRLVREMLAARAKAKPKDGTAGLEASLAEILGPPGP
ncbi:MAG: ABC transporter ATP-binding protein [Kiritimatiellae bacterium]|nr:ABC transporter ATP-binding protein [Kiritimatiellia bacterium]